MTVTVTRCKPPQRTHIWPEWRTIWALVGLQQRNCERCGKKALRTDPAYIPWSKRPAPVGGGQRDNE